MVNELERRLGEMTAPGDTVICALSGGADSVALLFGCYLLKDRLGFRLEAAHYNHGLRGEESDGDEAFVKALCHQFDILLHVGRGTVVPGEKGLEAAAREARYAFFVTLDGKIATAHTADDNAETVLMHLVRGTGLKGLGGIAPVRGKIIRPMLGITRARVLAFLEEYHLSYRTDSSNETDAFLRNRLRHHVMPLLKAENPRLAENLSAMALRLREDEEALAQAADYETLPPVSELRALPKAVRSRMLERFLKDSGVKEPEAEHIALAEKLVFSGKPSAKGNFPNGVRIGRSYDTLRAVRAEALEPRALPVPGRVDLPKMNIRITARAAQTLENTADVFTVQPQGQIWIRPRQTGDSLRLPGGSKTVKKLFVDQKIPAHLRELMPIISDDAGILGIYAVGPNQDRIAKEFPAVQIHIERIE